MWTRSELKRRAKAAFLKNYWICVLVALILVFVTGEGAGRSTSRISVNHQPVYEYHYNYSFPSNGDTNNNMIIGDQADPNLDFDQIFNQANKPVQRAFDVVQDVLDFIPVWVIGLIGTIGVLVGLAVAAGVILLGIFVFNVVEVGGCKFFITNMYTKAEIGELLSGFKSENYMTIVVTQFFRGLFTFLWGLLFIIPGIIKGYEYCMIPYLLADDPFMTREEAFRRSKEMMDGNKWNTFVLDLSFIGWEILSGLTVGILGIFYVNPYKFATKAELYQTLKTQSRRAYYQSERMYE